MAHKRTATATATVNADSLLERIPENILNEVFLKLEPETLTTLCSVACVSRTLRSSVHNALSSFSSVDLSSISLDSHTFNGIRRRFGKLSKLTLDCLRLNDSSISSFLGPDVEELVLLKCCSLSYNLLVSIGKTCPNLRVLTLEFSGYTDKSALYDTDLQRSFANCLYLESLRIKVRGEVNDDYGIILLGICHLLPRTIKTLTVQPVTSLDIFVYLKTYIYNGTRVLIDPTDFGHTLTHLSLVLDCITDVMLRAVAQCLLLLTELDLKDEPTSEPFDDLTDSGVQSLINCKHLNSLSLIRSRKHFPTSFKRVTDMGMFLLSEGCKGLESVRFSGFSKVSDAGFASILNSCSNLKIFEIQNAFYLTDLTFQDFGKVHRSLTEVKLVSCSSITSDAIAEVASCDSLEVLDLFGCKSVADSCLGNISRLDFLTYLNLGGADITDNGMVLLGKGNNPISFLSLRGCKRVTDKGIFNLLKNGGKIVKTLSTLDLGHMPGITDNAITTIVDNCIMLTELCIRNCFYVTDESMKVLALNGSKVLRKLDIYNCSALSVECFELLKKPFFRGLNWIGIGRTRLICVGDEGLDEVYRERPWLTICMDGCEVGCHDGWQYHKFGR